MSSSATKGTSNKNVKKLKAVTKNWSKQLVNNIKTSKLGKGVSAASTKISTAGAKLAETGAGKAIAAAAPVMDAIGPVVDIAMGAVNIASHAQEANVSGGRKAYNITGDVVGTGANIVSGMSSLIGGPVAIAIMVFQLCGAILDAAWNPFKNYFNSDLETIRLAIIDQQKVAYKEANMNYPIETKPDILSSLEDPDSEQYKTYMNFVKKYLDDRGLISKEEVLAEEEYVLALKSAKRQRKLYRTNEAGELEMMNPDDAAISLMDSATNNDLVMIALAARYGLIRKRSAKPENDLSDINYTNYIIGATVISCLFLIFFFSSIFIASV